MAIDKLMLTNIGSVMAISSPEIMSSDRGLSKFGLVAFSNAGGFCIYNVLEVVVILGDLSRKLPSRSC